MIGRWVIALLGAICLCGSFYFLGRSHAEVKIVKEKVEVIKYVARKNSEIQAQPNANRDSLLKLMREGKL